MNQKLIKDPGAFTDPTLHSVEVYNHNAHTVIMYRDKTKDEYILKHGDPRKGLGPHTVLLKPGTRALLPHGFYASYFENSKELAPLTAILGNSIGKGETLPSPPIAEPDQLPKH